MRFEIPLGHPDQLALKQRAAQGGKVIDEEFAVEVIVLVLDDAGGITAVLLVVLDEILIHITDFNTGRTHHVLVDPGQAQTPFAETPFVTEAFVNLGVDKSFLEIGQFGLFLGPRRSIDHEHADAFTHLRCGKPYPIGIVHRLPHVGDELLQAGIIRGNVCGCLAQHGRTINVNR